MKRLTWLKLAFSGVLVALVAITLITPAEAIISGGTVVNLSPTGTASPDIEISSDGQAVAVAYYKQISGGGLVYVKSATGPDGWVTSTQVGFGSEPQLIFKSGGPPYVVYVVWRKNGGTAIQSAECTLAATTAPTCTPGADVQTAGSDQLNFPDIAIASGVIHVVWQNSTGTSTTIIEAAHSTSANSLAGWSSPVSVIGTGVNHNPVLAISGSNLHLAFASGSNTALTSINYRRSTDGGSSWGSSSKTYTIGAGINDISNAHDSVDNPTITTSGSNVYLAWDAHVTGSNDFSLIYAKSTDNGSSWSSSPLYVDSNDSPANVNPGANARSSLLLAQPPQQVGLRPSLTISSTSPTVVPAIAWQQLPASCSLGFGALYYYRAGSLNGDNTADYLDNPGDNDSMIDPDLAVASGNVHQVYMSYTRDGSTIPSCPPGDAGTTSYLITYRGPFTQTINDKGEGGGTYLPIIKKNS